VRINVEQHDAGRAGSFSNMLIDTPVCVHVKTLKINT
jgi:hypothetical protein